MSLTMHARTWLRQHIYPQRVTKMIFQYELIYYILKSQSFIETKEKEKREDLFNLNIDIIDLQ